ncbi:MAG: hypothetical protein M3Q30_15200 [Actinomycetota bacterium]|nr:hypothetical protein [Actinomycetota bacterium]
MVVDGLLPPPEQAASTSESTKHAAPAAVVLVGELVREDLSRSFTGVIFSFARR